MGTGIESCRATLALCEREEGVFAALGIHPHQAAEAEKGDLSELRELLGHPKAVAVGETGLDYYRDYAPRDRQAALFEAQLALASELGKAVVVHSRAADDDTAASLAGLAEGTPVILHCFSSARLLEPALEHGWFVSFAGQRHLSEGSRAALGRGARPRRPSAGGDRQSVPRAPGRAREAQ